MFHVSTLIPIRPNDPTRKRHIGNDLVVIIFRDEAKSRFDPLLMQSRYNHLFVVVENVPCPPPKVAYRIQVVAKQGVPTFPPFVPDSGVVRKSKEEFREWFLTKLINAERAVLRSPTFVRKYQSARNHHIEKIFQNYFGRAHSKGSEAGFWNESDEDNGWGV
eukprot:TRINITY_DN8617_c0_g1_i3.p2 TRINITY_DN8617_c0_g1~~TRINITY_DN8617_c0_g1_i3.p2  ORF type:complete len:162 (+),score=35.97 TRINITY_DN8617_c0_g1_i3:171-656(+)